MPLKTPDEIDRFFTEKSIWNHMKFVENDFNRTSYRMGCKHFFVDNRFYRNSRALHFLDKIIAKIQLPFRDKKRFYYHSALFSFDRRMCEFLMNSKDIIDEKYKYSFMADESLFGTIIKNSSFANDINTDRDTRYIDWERRVGSSPHTFTIQDKMQLMDAMNNKQYLFARKFSENKDLNIVNIIFDELTQRKLSKVES